MFRCLLGVRHSDVSNFSFDRSMWMCVHDFACLLFAGQTLLCEVDCGRDSHEERLRVDWLSIWSPSTVRGLGNDRPDLIPLLIQQLQYWPALAVLILNPRVLLCLPRCVDSVAVCWSVYMPETSVICNGSPIKILIVFLCPMQCFKHSAQHISQGPLRSCTSWSVFALRNAAAQVNSANLGVSRLWNRSVRYVVA